MMGANCEDDSCVDTFEKCGGTWFNSSVSCCEDNAMCVVKNYFYAQCLTAEDAESNIDMWGWDGRVLDCEEMPEELMPVGAEDMYGDEEGMYGASRRMLQVGGYGDYGSTRGMTYGSKGVYGMDGTYAGDRDFELPADAPGPVMVDDTPAEAEEMPVEEPIEEDMPTTEMPKEEDMAATAPVTEDTEIFESDLVLGDGCTTCAPIFGQCADKGDIVSCCGEGLQCTKKNGFYAQCLPASRAARNVENFEWDGAVLPCGTVML